MIYDRQNKSYIVYQESKLVKFLYNNLIGRLILKLLTRKCVTNLVATYMHSPLSKRKIKRFIKKNNINMNEYVDNNYKNFDDFFVREIKKESRPMNAKYNSLISPCDAKLSVYKIDDDTHFHIKNSCYTVKELLQDDKLANEYKGGTCLVFRLSVDDYHHYAFVDDGKIIYQKKIDGLLHTVRPLAHQYCKVFSENKREYALLQTKHFGKIIQMEVGALLVGRICNLETSHFFKGEEKGFFRFGGSTIILLIPKNKVKIDQDIIANSLKGIETKVKIYEKIGKGL